MSGRINCLWISSANGLRLISLTGTSVRQIFYKMWQWCLNAFEAGSLSKLRMTLCGVRLCRSGAATFWSGLCRPGWSESRLGLTWLLHCLLVWVDANGSGGQWSLWSAILGPWVGDWRSCTVLSERKEVLYRASPYLRQCHSICAVCTSPHNLCNMYMTSN